MTSSLDVLIIGGGPAGLTAALYLARFRRNVLVVSGDGGRAARIPRTHNYPGFPDGIPGVELVARMREQAHRYGTQITDAWVTNVEAATDGFIVRAQDAQWSAKKVLLATGVEDIDLDYSEVDLAVMKGRLRYCPICDGYEIVDKDVAVIANSSQGVCEAIFLRHFTQRLTVVPASPNTVFTDDDKRRLADARIALREAPLTGLQVKQSEVAVECEDGKAPFDSLYCALGTRVRSDLALAMGAECDESGYVVTDAHQQTSVPGLYAAGDVSQSINQIAVAAGEAAIAASAIHRALNKAA